MTINRGEQAVPPQHRTTCDDASDTGDERHQDQKDATTCDEASDIGDERHQVLGDYSPVKYATTVRHRSRLLIDLVVLILALATPTVLVLVGQVGVALLLAVAEFGALIMRTWWSRPGQ